MSSRGRRMSKAERAVLERQRELAARLSGVDPNKTTAGGGGGINVSTNTGGAKRKAGVGSLLGGSSTTNTSGQVDGSKTSNQNDAPTSALAKQQRLLLQSKQRQKLDAVFQKSSSSSALQRPQSQQQRKRASSVSSQSAGATHKRPSFARPNAALDTASSSVSAAAPVVSKTDAVAAAVAAAKARLGASTAKPATTTTSTTSSSTTSNKTSSSGANNILSQLTTAATTAATNSKQQHFPHVEADDYWRDVRKWNFLKDLEQHLQQQGPNNNSSSKQKPDSSSKPPNEKDNPPPPPPSSLVPKTIPNTFLNASHYLSSWAPLCLAESRAQLLNEFASNLSRPLHHYTHPWKPIAVSVHPLKSDVGSHLDHVSLQLKERTEGNPTTNPGGVEFMPNDIVLLLRHPTDVVVRMANPNNAAPGSHPSHAPKKKRHPQYIDPASILPPSMTERRGLLGHTDQKKKRAEGLIVRVSRRIWTEMHTTDMYLVKIGNNVTALREFTALCKVKQIPLLKYLLSIQQPPSNTSETNPNPNPNSNSSGNNLSAPKSNIVPVSAKSNLLASMGGSAALGPGFAKYAEQKFNNSQLGAIAAAATEYGAGGFTLVKGPPGTGKTTTLVAIVNSLHIRQYNKYYEDVRRISTDMGGNSSASNNSQNKSQPKTNWNDARKSKPRILVCAPSNAAVDNIILKIMEVGFVDGNGHRYNPSIVRVGAGQSSTVRDVSLEAKVEATLAEGRDVGKLEAVIAAYRVELGRLQQEILRLRRRLKAIELATPWALSEDWEIRIDEETFDQTGRVYFVNHAEKTTTFDIPPQPLPGRPVKAFSSMPEYKAYVGRIVQKVEQFNGLTSRLERYALFTTQAISRDILRQQIETHILDAAHVVLTTLGTSGSRVLESAAKFEVVVVDEAAQSVEPATLAAMQLGSSHAILVGDPQQLPATIFSLSGRDTKYDRSLFQRLEESGHAVHMLNTQYRMHPMISDFPRHIFYGGNLLDGPNVQKPDYGGQLRVAMENSFPNFKPLTILDLDSAEERGGTSLSNTAEARLALHLYKSLDRGTGGTVSRGRVALITPYSQQAATLNRTFAEMFGSDGFENRVEINTVDAYQGRESNIVIFSCVRAAGSRGIGFLSDVRRMNVGLTRAKHYLFIIARCRSIVVNPYWRELVNHARESGAIVTIPRPTKRKSGGWNQGGGGMANGADDDGFPVLDTLVPISSPRRNSRINVSVRRNEVRSHGDSDEEGQL